MKTQIKTVLISGLISGIVYAGLMAGFDYFNGHDFKIWKLIFNVLFFGIFMGLFSYYNMKKRSKKKEDN